MATSTTSTKTRASQRAAKPWRSRGKATKRKKRFERTGDPSPEEIAERAAAIRATWSESERERRLVCPDRVAWTPPLFAEADLELAPTWD